MFQQWCTLCSAESIKSELKNWVRCSDYGLGHDESVDAEGVGGVGGRGGGGGQARPQGTRSWREAAALPTFAAAPNCSGTAAAAAASEAAVEGTDGTRLSSTHRHHIYPRPPQQVSFTTEFFTEGNSASDQAKSDQILQNGNQPQIKPIFD